MWDCLSVGRWVASSGHMRGNVRNSVDSDDSDSGNLGISGGGGQ